MAKFSVAYPIKMVVKGASTAVIPNAQGIPVAVNTPARAIEIPSGIYETKDPEIIDRIKSDIFFNTPNGIIEISEEEQEAIKIREAKNKEADEMIKEAKKKKLVK